ncbi:hypothetical protein POM88_052459 [Heracleum sosnowskyi]|uniref:Uncharacterized protein n=1 Tax=Heracleum sosnowskyi TaxID=360622 RepID=A0AAD8GSB0_9APIA|nr:hypothetical protein POM88_052459 [Heracleum sosnowskyi]
MEKAVHSRPVSEEDEALSCSKKLKLEGSMSSEDPEKYILFTDSEYKLPFYLSEFALSEFNSKKETKYEKVNVIKAMKYLGVEKETTYLVIFEASLPNDMSYNVQTFEAKIYMSALEPTTKIKIKFVRIKPSESSKEDSEKVLCDKSDKKDNEEKLSELDKKEPEVKLSEFAEKDTEEKLSDFNVQDSSPEKLAESDEKYAEKKLAEIDGKDSAQELAKINVKTSAEENLVVRKTPKRRSSQNKKGPEYYKEVKQYSMDLAKSDGFEVGIYPHMSYSCCMIQCYYNPPNRNLSTAYLNQLVYLTLPLAQTPLLSF